MKPISAWPRSRRPPASTVPHRWVRAFASATACRRAPIAKAGKWRGRGLNVGQNHRRFTDRIPTFHRQLFLPWFARFPTGAFGGGVAGFLFLVALHSKLILQHPRAYLLHLSGLQLAQLERPIRDPDQTVHRQPHSLHSATNFAVFALAQPHRDPCVGTLLAVQGNRHGLELFAINFNTLAQWVQRFIGGPALDPHPILAQPTR